MTRTCSFHSFLKFAVRLCVIVMALIPAATLLLRGSAWAESPYKTLHAFTQQEGGYYAHWTLIFDEAGNLYGTSCYGGPSGAGTVWKLAPNPDGSWTESTLHEFTGGDDGFCPQGALIFDADGNLYSSAFEGGTYGAGNVFELTPNPDGSWTEKVLYNFTGYEGNGPNPIIFDAQGAIYGTVTWGAGGWGGVFRLTQNPDGNWSESTIHTFTGPDGGHPVTNLIWHDGSLYGTTYSFGIDISGTVFGLTPNPDGSWTENVLHLFTGWDGSGGGEGLIFDNAGNLYGGTWVAGSVPGGTIFELTPNPTGPWTETVLHRFTGGTDGYSPGESEFVFDKLGNLYGTTRGGGAYGYGVLFKLAPNPDGSWTETVLQAFDNAPGGHPAGGVILDAAGNAYGTTAGDNSTTFGSVYEYSLSYVWLSPDTLSFSAQRPGTWSPPQSATLNNTTSKPVTIRAVAITGDDSGDYKETNSCGGSLAAGNSCTINVTFTPSATGTRNATLTVTSGDTNSPHSISLTGVGAMPAVTLSSTNVNLGTWVVGTHNWGESITLTNTGAVALNIMSIGVFGVNSGDFSAPSDCPLSPATLGAGRTCTIYAVFAPTAIGLRNAAVIIFDDAAENPQQINLSGTGQGISQTMTFKEIGIGRYGMAPFALTASASSGLPVTFKVISGPATVAGNMVTLTGAGTVTIEADQVGNSRYAPAPPVEHSFTVRSDTLVVTAASYSVRYGSAIPTLTYHFTGFVNGDTSAVLSGAPNLTTTAKQSSGVGWYWITIAQGTLSAANYQFMFVNGTLKVLPANLTVRPNAELATYGAALPALDYTITGFVNGDTSAVVSGSPVLSTTGKQGSPAGSYAITATQGNLSAQNYTFLFASGHLTIRKAQLNVTADNKTVAYGQQFPPLTYTVTGFVNGDTSSVVTGAPTLGVTGAAPGSPPGQYEIGVNALEMKASNYFFHAVDGVLTIQ